jgi:hypothetical protein
MSGKGEETLITFPGGRGGKLRREGKVLREVQ